MKIRYTYPHGTSPAAAFALAVCFDTFLPRLRCFTLCTQSRASLDHPRLRTFALSTRLYYLIHLRPSRAPYSLPSHFCLASSPTRPPRAAEVLHPDTAPPPCRSPSVTSTRSTTGLLHAANACIPPCPWRVRTPSHSPPLRALRNFPLANNAFTRPPKLLLQSTRRRQLPITLEPNLTRAQALLLRKRRPPKFPAATLPPIHQSRRTTRPSANGTCPPLPIRLRARRGHSTPRRLRLVQRFVESLKNAHW